MTYTYASVLDALGHHLTHLKAEDVLINEIEGGFLVAYLDPQGQRVITCDRDELQSLITQARQRFSLWRPAHNKNTLRSRMEWIGSYLDRRSASNVVIQERLEGVSLEYTGVTATSVSLTLERLSVTLSHTQLATLNDKEMVKSPVPHEAS